MARRRGGFFGQAPDPQDELAREQDVAALLQPRRSVVQDLPVERVHPNPFQARQRFEGLEELADAIRVQGFVSRLRVRPHPEQHGHFQLVYGERRLRAARLAGLATVPCEVAEHSDEEMIEIGLAENIQRQDLSPLEEAQAFQTFVEQRGYSIRRLAERIGKHKDYVGDRLALLRMPEDVQAMVAARPDTLRAAREIAKLATPAERAPLLDAVVAGNLNVREVRGAVREATVEQGSEHRTEERRRTARRERRQAPRRVIRRDARTWRTLVGRWRGMVPELGDAERDLLRGTLTALIQELERLQRELDT